MEKTAIGPDPVERAMSERRRELVTQLHYDRADVAQLDPTAAEMLDVAIALLYGTLNPGRWLVEAPLPQTDRRVH